MPTVSLTYSGTDQSATATQDWLILEQDSIPQSQQQCTAQDIKAMLALAAVGQPATSYTSDKCPVSRRIGTGGSIIASYSANILVHRSISLDNNYDLTQSEGRLSLGQTIHRKKETDISIDYRQVVQLGWLPAGIPQYGWLTKIKDIARNRVFLPEKPDQDNGFLYFQEEYKGRVEVSGRAIVDKYILTIEHQQGFKWDKKVLLTAEWGAEDENGNRKSVQLEIKLPKCVEDEFNKCPGDAFSLLGQEETSGEPWNVFWGEDSWKVWIGACSGKILKDEKLTG